MKSQLLAVLLREVAHLRDEGGGNERAYYRYLQDFLERVGKDLKIADVRTDAEQTAGGEIGFPDITVRAGAKIVGWLEVKLPDDDITAAKFNAQFAKYRDNLENIVFTNFRQWQLWQWDADADAALVARAEFDLDGGGDAAAGRDALSDLLDRFFKCHRVRLIHDSRQKESARLAKALAKKTKLLSEQARENFGAFERLRKAFEKVLIQKLDESHFASLIAETFAYSLLLAKLEHAAKAPADAFDLKSAGEFLPPNVSFLHDLYDLFSRRAGGLYAVRQSAAAVLDELLSADIGSLYEELTAGGEGGDDDPAVNFYEPFLAEYNPAERRARGVYYTPRPVVDFIVSSVDMILRDADRFGIVGGLANKSVSLLDPATGTGAFLLSAIRKIGRAIYGKFGDAGLAAAEFKTVVEDHVLQNFFGFELMVAPYAIAHLKLALELERLGYRFSRGGSRRLRVYLANALDNPGRKPDEFAFADFPSIAEESEAALRVKKETDILVVLGNPPYANFGMMNKQAWLKNALAAYKAGLGERKVNLDDDYVKFIRFAQLQLEKTGKGVFAMITANSFLDGVTHRRMRESLLETFDEIYIYNLHGNARRGETTPDGGVDQNVFDIMTGVSINIFVKLPKGARARKSRCVVRSADAWGMRADKFAQLATAFDEVAWEEVDYQKFNRAFVATAWGKSLGRLNFFVPQRSAELIREYGGFTGVRDIFIEHNSGIQTKRDEVTIQFDDAELNQVIARFCEWDAEKIRREYKLRADGRDWKIAWAQKDLRENKPPAVDIAYRPFDTRRTVCADNSKGFVAYPRYKTMRHMLLPNLGLAAPRLLQTGEYRHAFCVSAIMESGIIAGHNSLFPLYLYSDNGNLGKAHCRPNISSDFIAAAAAKIGARDIAAADVFYYIYALLHCPTYRARYAELLKFDFPRLPLTSDAALFGKLVALGNRLVNLHLLGDNPFDADSDEAELFATPNRWGARYDGNPLPGVDGGQIARIVHNAKEERVIISDDESFWGIDRATWEFKVGGYQPLRKWLSDRAGAGRALSLDDIKRYMQIAVALRETQKTMRELATLIPTFPLP